jgi:hypothetical protein
LGAGKHKLLEAEIKSVTEVSQEQRPSKSKAGFGGTEEIEMC